MSARGTGRDGLAAAVLLCMAASSAPAQDMPAYRDDRSSPQALIESLYNAVARQENLRAWSYFDAEASQPFDAFEAGYADTVAVRARVLEGTVEGAAGSLYGLVPVAIEARTSDGRTTVFSGCYETRQVQPAAQIRPPFEPIRITASRLEETATGFDATTPTCPAEGL